MSNSDPCPELRTQIRALQQQRRTIESKLLQPQTLRTGSLVERYLAGREGKRGRPAYYLSRSQQGRSKLTYIKKEELATVRRHCDAYRAFQQNWTAWRQLTAALEDCWKRLQEAQSR